MKALLDALPPKLLALSSDNKAVPVELKVSDLSNRVEQVVQKIQKATFTGKGDAETVPQMYKNYIKRIADALQATLAFATAEASKPELPMLPTVDAQEGPPLRLADGPDEVHLGMVGKLELKRALTRAGKL